MTTWVIPALPSVLRFSSRVCNRAETCHHPWISSIDRWSATGLLSWKVTVPYLGPRFASLKTLRAA